MSILDIFRYGRKIPQAVSSLDNVVNPNTYKALFGQVDDVLKRALPQRFQGVGIQNAPSNLIGQVSDVANMPSGAAREAARNQLQSKFQMAGRLDDAIRPTGGQGLTESGIGTLRAPTVPSSPRSFDLTMPRGARASSGTFKPDLNATFQGPGLPPSKVRPGPVIPSGGQKVPPLTAFGGVNPIVGNIPTSPPVGMKVPNKNLIQQASQYLPKGPLGYLGRGFQVFEGAQVVDNLRKGNYGQAAMNTALMFPGKTFGAVKGLLPVGGLGVAGLTGLGLIGLELGAPASVADGTINSPEAKKMNEVYNRLRKDTQPEQGEAVDIEAIKNLPGGLNNPILPVNPNQDLPASAEQSVDTTPFQHQMALYDQGRRAATTQAERNQVRDLGLAIHKEHNPHLYSDFQVPRKTDRLFNPTLSNQPTAVFPDGYPETLEAYIKEGGVQMPYTMTNKDARNEVIEANRLEGQQAAAAMAQELQAQEFMKAFMQQQAGKK